VGVGGGADIGLFDSVGTTDTTYGAVASGSGKFFGEKLGAKVEYQRRPGNGGPCHGLDGEVQAGPFRWKKDLLHPMKEPRGNAKLKAAELTGVPAALGAGVSAKLAGKACGGATWVQMGF
jgi:hypothetical protein